MLSSVSALLCGARVLDDVRREAQTGQRTRRQARSQVLTSRGDWLGKQDPGKKRVWEKVPFLEKRVFQKNAIENLLNI